MLIYNFGDWTEWLVPQKVTFLGEEKLIILHETETSIDAQIDLYSAWKEWMHYYDNAKWAAAFRTFGGDTTGENQFAPRYFFLINGWKVLAKDMSVVVQINLYSDDGESPFIIDNAAVTNRASDVPSVKSDVETRLEFGDRIYFDANSEYAGISYPNGTIAQPINNITDAILVAELYNIRTFYCLSDVNIESAGNTYEDYTIVGDRENLTVSIVDGNYLNNIEWTNFIVDAYFGGGINKFVDCRIINILDVSGQLKSSEITGTIRVWDYLISSLCYSGVAGSGSPVWDMNEDRVTSLSIRSYSGGVDLRFANQSGDTSTVELIAGQIKLNENCTDGYVDLRGVGYITDNSSGTTINSTGFVDSFATYIEETRAIDEQLAYQNELYYDPINGFTGSTYPIGTSVEPVNNIPELYYMSEYTTGIKNIIVRNNFTVSGVTSLLPPGTKMDNFTITADSPATKLYIYDEGIAENVSVNNFDIMYALIGGLPNSYHNCRFHEIYGLAGYVENSYLFGKHTDNGIEYEHKIRIQENTTLVNCYPGESNSPPVFWLTNTGGTNLSIRGWNGDIILDKVEHEDDRVALDVVAGKIHITSGCTEGYIELRGVGYFIDESGSGCTINTTGFVNSFEVYIEETRAIDEQLAYGDKIYIDQIGGHSGNTYPVGTIAQPVKNAADIFIISARYNIKNFHIVSDFRAENTGLTFENTAFVGARENLTLFSTGNTFNHCQFNNLLLDVNFNHGHENQVINSTIINALNLNGNIDNSQLGTPDQQSTMTIYNSLILSDCYSGNVGGFLSKTPIFDMIEGVDSHLAVRNYSGGVNIFNCDTPNSQATIDLTGQAKFNETCTDGFIDLRGVGYFVDDSSTGCTVKTDGFVNSFGTYIEETKETDEVLAYGGRIYLDGMNGFTGSTYPVGTIAKPVNNLADLLILSERLNIKDNYVIGSFMFVDASGNTSGIPEDFIGYNNYAVNVGSQLRVNSDETGIINNSKINGFFFNNSDYKGRLINIDNCVMENIYNLHGKVTNSTILGDITILGSVLISNSNSRFDSEPPKIKMMNSGSTLSLKEYSGSIIIDEMQFDTNNISIDVVSTKIIINSGVTAGQIDLRGVGYLEDNSGSGCTVITTGFVDSFETYIEDTREIDEQLSYQNKIYIDQVNGHTGTTYPIGTQAEPFKEMLDMFIVSNQRGIKNVQVVDELHIDNLFFVADNFNAYSDTPYIPLYLDSTAGSNLYNININGFDVVDADFYGHEHMYEKCIFRKVSGVGGHVINCGLDGGGDVSDPFYNSGLTYIGVEGNTNFVGCYPKHAGDIPKIRLTNLSGTSCAFRDWNGTLEISTMEHENDLINIDMNAGKIILTSGCTSGIIDIRGVGYVDDNSGSNCTVIRDGLSQASPSEYDGRVVIDTTNGEAGVNFPIGTMSYPVNNLTDALLILNRYSLQEIFSIGTLQLTGGIDVSNIAFTAERSTGNYLFVVDAITDNTYFENLTTNVIQDGTCRYTTCVLLGVDNFDGGAKDSLIVGEVDIIGDGSNYFTNCDTYTTDLNNFVNIKINDKKLNIIRGRGFYDIINKIGTDTTTIDLSAGIVRVSSGCTSGVIYIGGTCEVIDNSSVGCTVISQGINLKSIEDSIWNASILEHTEAGSTGDALYNVSAGADPNLIANTVWTMQMSAYTNDEGSAGYTLNEIFTSTSGLTEMTDEIHADVKRILGLTQENFRIVDHVYTGENLDSATIKIFNNSSDCDNNLNPLETYFMEALYDTAGKLIDYKVTRS